MAMQRLKEAGEKAKKDLSSMVQTQISLPFISAGANGPLHFEASLTRAMVVTILYRYDGSPAVNGASPFADVAEGSWYADAVIWAEGNSIVNGTSETTFSPDSPITREQFAAIMFRYAAYRGYSVSARADLSAYTDAGSISAYAVEAMQWAVAEELISGVTATTLDPQGYTTRAQAAIILMRFAENFG